MPSRHLCSVVSIMGTLVVRERDRFIVSNVIYYNIAFLYVSAPPLFVIILKTFAFPPALHSAVRSTREIPS